MDYEADEIYYLARSGHDGWQRAVDKYRKKWVVRSDDPTVPDYLKRIESCMSASTDCRRR